MKLIAFPHRTVCPQHLVFKSRLPLNTEEPIYYHIFIYLKHFYPPLSDRYLITQQSIITFKKSRTPPPQFYLFHLSSILSLPLKPLISWVVQTTCMNQDYFAIQNSPDKPSLCSASALGGIPEFCCFHREDARATPFLNCSSQQLPCLVWSLKEAGD